MTIEQLKQELQALFDSWDKSTSFTGDPAFDNGFDNATHGCADTLQELLAKFDKE